jgi:hypothetical protein
VSGGNGGIINLANSGFPLTTNGAASFGQDAISSFAGNFGWPLSTNTGFTFTTG